MLYGKCYRFHHALTERGSVAGVDINVSAPEAFRTVIGVAIPLDGDPTMRAGEIFNVTLKFFVHGLVPTFLPSASLSNVRFRLGDAVAARSKSQCSRTNSLKNALYSLPTGRIAPCAGIQCFTHCSLLTSTGKRYQKFFRIRNLISVPRDAVNRY